MPRARTHLGVVRTVEALNEVRRLSIRHLAEPSDQATRDHALLPTDDANLKPGILWCLEHCVSVEAVERLGCVLTRNLVVNQDCPPAGMEVGETRKVVDFCIYDDPLRKEIKVERPGKVSVQRSTIGYISEYKRSDQVAIFVVLRGT